MFLTKSVQLTDLHVFQSHPAEPGPDFVLTKFDSSGHSPLVEHCLRQQRLAKDVGVSRLISRKVAENLDLNLKLSDISCGLVIYSTLGGASGRNWDFGIFTGTQPLTS